MPGTFWPISTTAPASVILTTLPDKRVFGFSSVPGTATAVSADVSIRFSPETQIMPNFDYTAEHPHVNYFRESWHECRFCARVKSFPQIAHTAPAPLRGLRRL